jgi:hypothetical protein
VFEIGSSLRAAREHQQLALADVERATHIRAKYLGALEDERWDVLPGSAYVKGFLRTYADFLGLEGWQFVEEWNERFAQDESVEPAQLVRVQRRRRPLDAWLVLVPVALAAIGFASWRLATGGSGHHAALAPPPPSTQASTKTPVAPAPKPAKPAKPALARVELVAARGPCWLMVRLGSDTGRTLYQRVLETGQRASFVARRLWIRFGAPWNVDATLNGKRTALPVTIGDVVFR